MSEDLPQRISEDTVTGYCQKECQKECEKIWECQKISKNYMQLRRAARQWTYTAYNTKMLALELHDIRLMRLFQSFFFWKRKNVSKRAVQRVGPKKTVLSEDMSETKPNERMSGDNVRKNVSKYVRRNARNAITMAAHRSRSQVITGYHRSSQVIAFVDVRFGEAFHSAE